MIPKLHIVDADTHVNEAPDLWEKRMPSRYRERAPRVVDLPRGQAWLCDGMPIPITTLINVAGQSPVGWQPIAPDGYRSMRPGGWDPAARLADMDIDMIGIHVLFPSYALIMVRAQAGGGEIDREFHLALVRAYNDWMSEISSAAPERLWGLAILPITGVDDAIAEAKRARDLAGIRGVVPLTWPNGGGDPKPDDERFWSAIEEMELPVNLHIGFGEAGGADPDLPKNPDIMARLQSMPVINRERTASSMMPVLSEFILGGILERHPKLRLALVETGIGWIPFWCEQTDDNFLRHRFWTKCNLPMLPSDYWRRQCFATFQVDSYGLRNRDMVGVETILWSSDYPHSGADWPSSRRTIAEQMRGIPEAEQALILGGNARRLYGIGGGR